MHTSRQLLQQVMKRHSIESDSALARLLGLSRQAIGHHMKGRVFLGQETALHVAQLLDLAPDYVMACAEAERAQSDTTRRYWRDAAQRAGALAAAVFVAVFLYNGHELQGIDFIEQIDGVTSAQFLPLCIMLNAVFLLFIAADPLIKSRPQQ